MPKHHGKKYEESTPETRKARKDLVQARELVTRHTKKGIVTAAEEMERLLLMLETGLSPRGRYIISEVTKTRALHVLKKSIKAAHDRGEAVEQKLIERTTKVLEAEGMKTNVLQKAIRGTD